MATKAIEPLSRYPAIRTLRADEFEHRLKTVYGATGLVLPKPADLLARGNFVTLQDTALGFATCGTAATIDFGDSDFARLQLPLRGRERVTEGHVDVGMRRVPLRVLVHDDLPTRHAEVDQHVPDSPAVPVVMR